MQSKTMKLSQAILNIISEWIWVILIGLAGGFFSLYFEKAKVISKFRLIAVLASGVIGSTVLAPSIVEYFALEGSITGLITFVISLTSMSIIESLWNIGKRTITNPMYPIELLYRMRAISKEKEKNELGDKKNNGSIP